MAAKHIRTLFLLPIVLLAIATLLLMMSACKMENNSYYYKICRENTNGTFTCWSAKDYNTTNHEQFVIWEVDDSGEKMYVSSDKIIITPVKIEDVNLNKEERKE